MPLEPSILKSTKKILGVSDADDGFDVDIVMHINAALNTVRQLGVGPSSGVMIESDAEEWEALEEPDHITNAARSYVYLKVRLAFDAPGTPHHLTALKDQILESEHRLKYDKEVMPHV